MTKRSKAFVKFLIDAASMFSIGFTSISIYNRIKTKSKFGELIKYSLYTLTTSIFVFHYTDAITEDITTAITADEEESVEE